MREECGQLRYGRAEVTAAVSDEVPRSPLAPSQDTHVPRFLIKLEVALPTHTDRKQGSEDMMP